MTAPPWMPLDIGDYVADTGHLRTIEHGAYILLIMHYWRHDGLPNDDRQLARIARLTDDEWTELRPALVGLFKDGWRHKRIDAELAKARETMNRRSAAGKRAASVRYANRTTDAEQSDASLEQSNTQKGSVVVSVEAPPEKKEASPRERLDAIEREAREAAGLEQDPSPSLLSLAPLIGLLDAGYDWRVDILPELRKAKAKGIRPTTWAYYVPAITAGKAKNAAIPPKPSEKLGKPVVWLPEDDPRYPATSDRYARETGKAAKPHGSRHEDGLGFHFPAEFLPDSHPRDSFSQLSGTNGTQA